MSIEANKNKLISGSVPGSIMEKFLQFRKDNNLSTSAAISKIIEWYMNKHPEYLDEMKEYKELEQ